MSGHVEGRAVNDRAFRLFHEERELVARNWKALAAKYEGQYIAVLGTSILDSDTDFSALASRVYSRFGYRRIFMPLIATGERVYRMPSPRVVR